MYKDDPSSVGQVAKVTTKIKRNEFYETAEKNANRSSVCLTSSRGCNLHNTRSSRVIMI
jgi:hypothetical protein